MTNQEIQSKIDKSKLLFEEARKRFEESKYDEAERCAKEVLELIEPYADRKDLGEELDAASQKHMIIGLLAHAYNRLNTVSLHRAEYAQAIFQAEAAIGYSERIDNVLRKAGLLSNIGNSYLFFSDYSRCLEYYSKALVLHEALGDKDGVARVTGNIGLVYQRLSDYPRALEFLQRALALDEEIGDKNRISNTIGNIGLLYIQTSDYPRALERLQLALKMSEEAGNQRLVGYWMSGIAGLALETKNFEEAQAGFLATLRHRRDTVRSNEGVAGTLLELGECLREASRPEEAMKYLLEALALAEKLGEKEFAMKARKELAELYAMLGDGMEAYRHHKEFHALHAEVHSEETKKQSERFAIERRVALMEREREILAVKNAELTDLNLSLEAALEELRAIQEDLMRSERATIAANIELSEKNEKLRALDEEKNEFLGIVAHDLKNPLSLIIANIQMIERYGSRVSPGQLSKIHRSIELAATYMREIIMNLLDVNALESGAFTVRKSLLNVGEYAEKITEIYRERAAIKEIALEFSEIGTTLGIADENILKEVLENLISNAVKYSPQGKKVFVSVEKLG